ncbi:OLC1v1008409C1 [Oldenlandia corymbosa var. corymbosa]|uniref:OLC1v1008409C1 n=1 Tax=Oldenlandia corymbosa var. corymbosa TaxID=529605 RepID=A0AAV1DLL1_OLDCO|nr:OLC1v1008409C1 [Oldenlandia corymbosa var. corymbosa]
MGPKGVTGKQRRLDVSPKDPKAGARTDREVTDTSGQHQAREGTAKQANDKKRLARSMRDNSRLSNPKTSKGKAQIARSTLDPTKHKAVIVLTGMKPDLTRPPDLGRENPEYINKTGDILMENVPPDGTEPKIQLEADESTE